MAPIKQPRPKRLTGDTLKYQSGCGNIYIIVNKNDGKIFELFATLGKAGGCASGQLEAVTRCVSLGLRCGIPVQEFIEELSGIGCAAANKDDKVVMSCPNAIAKALQETLNE